MSQRPWSVNCTVHGHQQHLQIPEIKSWQTKQLGAPWCVVTDWLIFLGAASARNLHTDTVCTSAMFSSNKELVCLFFYSLPQQNSAAHPIRVTILIFPQQTSAAKLILCTLFYLSRTNFDALLQQYTLKNFRLISLVKAEASKKKKKIRSNPYKVYRVHQ